MKHKAPEMRSEDPVSYSALKPAVSLKAVATDELIAELLRRLPTERGQGLSSPTAAADYLRAAYAHAEREVFACLFLDTRHRVIALDELFHGTLDAATVYPREIVKAALRHNAAAIILCHNHPSGNPEPSQADKMLTNKLRDALALVDIRTLDHLVVGSGGVVSFAELGLL